jgi:2-keto-4-pentenoate hydratase/2-oxohepta-3-ene-1,7-dioic acid hydratase in catechol pathway
VRLARYEHNGVPHTGIIRGDMLHSVITRLSVLEILALPRAERDSLEGQAGRHFRTPIDTVRFLPPVEPRGMRDFLAFEAHISGMKRGFDGDGSVPEAWYEAPAFLFMNPWSLVGATDDVPMPPFTEMLDFELEIAAIVGRQARDVSAAEAGDYIAGYCVFNDWSARDIQRREMQVGLGPNKGKDFANTLGPWITTPDELEEYRIGDRFDLTMTVRVNGEELGTDSSRNLSWSFEEMLSHASRGAVVGAGDVLASGTCSRGALSEAWSRSGQYSSPRPLQIGDVVEMTIEGLGTLRNTITPTTSPGYSVPRARRTYEEDRL